MSGPWEKYGAPAAAASTPVAPPAAVEGPWAKYQQATPAGQAPVTAADYARRGAQQLNANGLGLKAALGGQQSPEMQRQLGLTVRAAAEGLASPATIIGNAANQAVNYGTEGINAVAGTHIPPLPMLSDTLDNGLTNVGVPEPQTGVEKGVGMVGNMIASAPTFAGVGKLATAAGVKGLEGLSQFTSGASKASPAEAPTNAAIKAMSQAAYDASEEAGAILKPEAIQGVAAKVQADLASKGYLPALQPQIGAVLTELDRVSGQPITAKGVDTLRQVALSVLEDGNRTERKLAGKIIDRIDDMMENIKPEDVVQGDAPEAAAQLVKARDAWKTLRKSELIDEAFTKAKRQAAKSGSGGNLQNAIKQRFASILDNPKLARKFTEEETAALNAIVNGSATENALRLVGKLSPQGSGLMAALGLGATAMHTPMIAAPIAGIIAKPLAERMTMGNVGKLSQLVRSAGQTAEPLQRVPLMPDAQATAARLLMQGTTGANSPYVRALIQQLGGGAIPATAGPNTGSQTRP
jgi:hypothetical protein